MSAVETGAKPIPWDSVGGSPGVASGMFGMVLHGGVAAESVGKRR